MFSETLKTFKHSFIYLPPNYDPDREYPVLYLLHGAGNDYTGWIFDGTADRIMDYQLSKGKAREMILAMPDGQVRPPQPRSGVELPVMSRTAEDRKRAYELHSRYFVNEVIPVVESKYRVSTDDRAIAGLSMGSAQTRNLIMTHPELFKTAGLFSGSLADAMRFSAVKDQLKRYKIVYIAVGKWDRKSTVESMRAAPAILDELGIPNKYFEIEGGHIWMVWQRAFVNFVAFI